MHPLRRLPRRLPRLPQHRRPRLRRRVQRAHRRGAQPSARRPRCHPELPFASSLCGACSEVCSARIPLAELIRELREDVVEEGFVAPPWAVGLAAYAGVTPRPRVWRALEALALPLLRRVPLDSPLLRGRGPLAAWTATRISRAAAQLPGGVGRLRARRVGGREPAGRLGGAVGRRIGGTLRGARGLSCALASGARRGRAAGRPGHPGGSPRRRPAVEAVRSPLAGPARRSSTDGLA